MTPASQFSGFVKLVCPNVPPSDTRWWSHWLPYVWGWYPSALLFCLEWCHRFNKVDMHTKSVWIGQILDDHVSHIIWLVSECPLHNVWLLHSVWAGGHELGPPTQTPLLELTSYVIWEVKQQCLEEHDLEELGTPHRQWWPRSELIGWTSIYPFKNLIHWV